MEFTLRTASDLREPALEILDGISRCRQETTKMLLDKRSTDSQLARTLYELLEYSGERIHSMLMLAEHGRLWDAEIIARSLQEATLKIVFICLADPEERRARLQEYSQDLYEIDLLKRSKRTQEILAVVDDEGLRSSFEPLVLHAVEEKELAEKWPGKKRKALQQKWSFTEMLKSLNGFFEQRIEGPIMDVMLHNYTLSSHLIHADDTALGVVADRLSREPDEQKAMEIAQRVRFLSDAFSLTAMSCTAIKQTFGVTGDPIRPILDELAPVLTRLHTLVQGDKRGI